MIDGEVEIYAWVGEDGLGSGVVGIKQGLVPAGCIPLVSTSLLKISKDDIVKQLQQQADTFGKTITLVRCTNVKDVITLTPKTHG